MIWLSLTLFALLLGYGCSQPRLQQTEAPTPPEPRVMTPTAAGDSLVLSRTGIALADIVLASDASAPERTAATELADHLQRVSGASFEIVAPGPRPGRLQIAVGPGAAKSAMPDLVLDRTLLGDDGIVLKTGGGLLVLTGAPGAKRGTLYAVYEFLERCCGIRWWTSSETFIPQRDVVSVPQLDHVYAPQLRYREPFYTDLHRDPIFSARSRVNGHFPAIPAKYGGQVGLLGWCHTFHDLIPPGKYFQDHPDWFGEIGGKRSNANGVQLCLTNEEMCKELTRNALTLVEKNPEAGIISISQVDYGKFCQCSRCRESEVREGSPSGALISFVNKVAEAVEVKHPDVLVETLAYLETAEPPKTVRPRRNVLVRVCGYDCSWTEPLASSTIPQNVTFKRQIEGWSAISPQLFVWDYVAGNTCFIQPHPNYHVVAPNLRLYAENKAIGIFAQGDTGTTCGDLVALRNWVMAKLMWNPSLDAEALTTEFLDGYYGPAGVQIRSVMRIASEAIQRSGAFLHTNRPIDTATWIGIEDLNRIALLFAQAETAVQADAERTLRLRRARFVWDYVWLQRYHALKREAAIRRVPFGGPADPAVARDAFLAAAREFELKWTGDGVLFSEVTAKALALRFKKEPSPPAACAGLAPQDWLEVQDNAFLLFSVPGCVSLAEDPTASDGSAARMPGNHANWSIQYIPVPELGDGKKWRCHVVARCEIKPGGAAAGPAFEMGIHGRREPPHPRAWGKLEEATDGKYRTYDLGSLELDSKMCLFVAPVKDAAAAVFVDRIFFVREK